MDFTKIHVLVCLKEKKEWIATISSVMTVIFILLYQLLYSNGVQQLRQINRWNRCFLSSIADSSRMKPVESSITKKLTESFKPQHLEVINESHMHNVPQGSESHFKVVVISETFDGQPLIKRHRMINENLADELQNSVHALSIVAKTPKQWEESGQVIGKSPPCRGGSGL